MSLWEATFLPSPSRSRRAGSARRTTASSVNETSTGAPSARTARAPRGLVLSRTKPGTCRDDHGEGASRPPSTSWSLSPFAVTLRAHSRACSNSSLSPGLRTISATGRPAVSRNTVMRRSPARRVDTSSTAPSRTPSGPTCGVPVVARTSLNSPSARRAPAKSKPSPPKLPRSPALFATSNTSWPSLTLRRNSGSASSSTASSRPSISCTCPSPDATLACLPSGESTTTTIRSPPLCGPSPLSSRASLRAVTTEASTPPGTGNPNTGPEDTRVKPDGTGSNVVVSARSAEGGAGTGAATACASPGR